MRHFIIWGGSALAITVLFTTPAAAQTALAASAAAAANDMVRYSFCTDSRTDRSTGRIREYYMARAFFSTPAQASIDQLLAELDAEEMAEDDLEISVPWENADG